MSEIEEKKIEDKTRLHPYLSGDNYLLLKQRSVGNNMSMSECLAYMIKNFTLLQYEITTHDVSKVTQELEDIVFRASGYYRNMVHAGKISKDLADHIARLYERIDKVLYEYYLKLLENRDKENADTENDIEELIKKSQKNLKRDRSVDEGKEETAHLNCRIEKEDYEAMLKKMELAGYDHTEKTRYLSTLINSKCLVEIDYYGEDIIKLNQIIYSATKPCETFIIMFNTQKDFSEQGNKTYECYWHIVEMQKEIWHIVINDRKHLYQKYNRKTKEQIGKKQKNERRKSYKERGK